MFNQVNNEEVEIQCQEGNYYAEHTVIISNRIFLNNNVKSNSVVEKQALFVYII